MFAAAVSVRSAAFGLIFLAVSVPASAFDHSFALLRDSVLIPFVSEAGVDYAALREHTEPLDRFLTEHARISFDEYQSFSREQQMAFLLNLYNAATLRLALHHWPIESLREIGGLFRSPWTVKFISLFDRTVSLGQILHDILRPEFRDPRVHFALSNAARGGPELSDEPFVAENLNEQLDRQTELFLRRVDINRFEDGVLYVSPIFRWYENDFGKKRGVREFAKRFFPDVTETTPIRYTDYDESLNSR